jgi:signal transduction histidine kinase
LWNLLHNAIKFTSRGGTVDARVTGEDGKVTLTVADNGRGISPEFLPHVFERFRQQDSSSTRESMGLGLGLSIAKHLVELHGGTIRAFSDGAGTGARFEVELPAM